MPLIKVATVFNIDLEFEVAPIPRRIGAYLVDFTLCVLFMVSMKYLYYGGSYSSPANSLVGLDILTISLPMLLYAPVSEILFHGQTAGKKLLQLRVVSLDGGEPAVSQYLMRWMFKVFEWPFFFGYTIFSGETIMAYAILTGFFGMFAVIIMAATKKSQRLGDLAANTVVVNTRSPFDVHDTIFMEVNEAEYKAKFPEVMRLSDRDINTIKNVLNHDRKERKAEVCERVAVKVQDVLQIKTEMPAMAFLQTLLADYNYLASSP